jgi:hypothetical protein
MELCVSLITRSVGIGGTNLSTDVKTVQSTLNGLSRFIPNMNTLVVDGALGSQPENSKTVAAIKEFQKQVVRMAKPDGRIDPRGRTESAMKSHLRLSPAKQSTHLPVISARSEITEDDYVKAAALIGCEVAAIKAVAKVETRGSAFLPSGRPKILYEAHIFSRNTSRIYDTTHPHISSKSWNRKLYKGGEGEYDRLIMAMTLNRKEALKAASWGKFQIMGFNHKQCGYSDVESFVKDMFESEAKHLTALVNYLKSTRLDSALVAKSWATFASGYNGPAYAENHYDTKLQKAYDEYKD